MAWLELNPKSRQQGDPWILSLADLLTLLLCFFVAIISFQGPRKDELFQGVTFIEETCLLTFDTQSAPGTSLAATKQGGGGASEALHPAPECRAFLKGFEKHRFIPVALQVRSCGYEDGEESNAAAAVVRLQEALTSAELRVVESVIRIPAVSCDGPRGMRGVEVRLRRS